MTNEQLIQQLEDKKMTDVLELIEEAKAGEFDELELVESLGLLRDEDLNRRVIALLEEIGVEIVYVTDEE
ncbi:hypothetical protein JCM19037_717 [Geomicrobium sp. JCM 19037]|uniref:hypothetical protein n=1 Tax=Geomicrobium sp. JCM 19037 TaxID=1460634 RepID=UPI00045F1084|nr:hypothetical protein [Geomicrobium sp. JCM 19037]GAK02481.1 hypothetical protein JCM19037_717 [Geomicrobium sp. JCM 19037]